MLGERIKEQRTMLGIKQTELARKIGVSKQSVSNWENNNILPSVELLVKLAKVFGCSTDYLVELDDHREFIEITNIETQQVAHIKRIAQDMAELNRALKEQGKN